MKDFSCGGLPLGWIGSKRVSRADPCQSHHVTVIEHQCKYFTRKYNSHRQRSEIRHKVKSGRTEVHQWTGRQSY